MSKQKSGALKSQRDKSPKEKINKSINGSLILATYGLLRFQYINMHFGGGDSQSIFRLALKLILGYSLE